ncbi:MAG: phosphoribosylformylglycinamidine cyclo-ligase [Fibrobacteria bacterium]|nr:phosphoribosylformylglycinamidine cyclo-ligase [Fibrobacteria bacterium]
MKYTDAGVDIQKAERAMSAIKSMVKSTFSHRVKADFGNFGGLFSIAGLNMKEPLLVSSIDGVGTKIRIAIEMEKFSYPGRDIVNHCVDDILVQGARPLFFMDYYATGVLNEEALIGVVEGLTSACKENKCALLGGETAEMPGIYHQNDFDLAGCIVGVVDKSKLIDGSKITAGDTVLGLASSGLHTNGFSMVRKTLLEAGMNLNETPPGFNTTLGEALVEPHKSYLAGILPLVEDELIHGLAHITGGGFEGNIPRILPEGISIKLDRNAWDVPPVFKLIQEKGNVETDEMYRTFNMGIGMVVIVPTDMAANISSRLTNAGEKVSLIGEAIHTDGKSSVVFE